MNTKHYYLYIFSLRVNQGSIHVINKLRNNNVSRIVYIKKMIEIVLNCSNKRNQLILMAVNQKHIDEKGQRCNAKCKSDCFLNHCIFDYVSFFCFFKTTVMLLYKEIDYNEISAIKKLSPFHIHPSLTCYFLVIKKLCFKHNNVLLVLVYNSCFTTPYPQPSEHHERVFHKNNNRKSPLYFIKSYFKFVRKIHFRRSILL